MTANDIVDLSVARSTHRALDKRYLEKICSEAEMMIILNAADPLLCLCRIWSMKESACKISLKKGAPRAFNPKKFNIYLDDDVYGRVESEFGNFEVQSVSGKEFVHSIATEDKNKLYGFGHRMNFENHSEEVRKAVLEDLKLHYSDLKVLSIEMNGAVPMLIAENGNLDISLSHHGNYIAWSYEIL